MTDRDLLKVVSKFTWPEFRMAAAATDRYTLYMLPDVSSKPASHRCCCRLTGQTDRRTDGRILDRSMTLNKMNFNQSAMKA